MELLSYIIDQAYQILLASIEGFSLYGMTTII